MNAVFHLAELYLLGTILYRLSKLKQQQKDNMANINERLAGIETKLSEASTEILALIETLRSESLTPEGKAALDAIEAKATALADIVPTPAPPPEP